MGIDGCHGSAYHFEARAGEALVQEHLQKTSESEGGFGIAQGSRFSENKKTVRVVGFLGRHHQRRRAAGQRRWKKPQAKFVIFNVPGAAVDACFQKEVRWIAKTRETQHRFQKRQRQQWNQKAASEAECPFVAR